MAHLKLDTGESQKNFCHLEEHAVGMNLLYFVGIIIMVCRI